MPNTAEYGRIRLNTAEYGRIRHETGMKQERRVKYMRARKVNNNVKYASTLLFKGYREPKTVVANSAR